jgi:uncharacterized membrane protein YfcA
MLSLSTSLFILGSVLTTSFLSGILGMAGGMILMGILVWILPVGPAIILHAIVQLFANGSRALIHREHLHRQSLLYYFFGLFIIFCAFAFISYVPDKLTVFILLGVSPFIAYALPKNIKLNITRPPQAVLCGMTVSGLQLAGGVAGPFLDIFFQNGGLTRHQNVATKACTQAVSHIAKFIYFGFIVKAAGDFFQILPPWLILSSIPTAIIGTSLAKHVLNRLTDKQFYKATQIALFGIGIVYLYKAFSLGTAGHAL